MSVTFSLGINEGNLCSMVPTQNEFNVSNHTATLLLGLIGIDTEELVGHLSVTQIRQIANLIDNPYLIQPTKVSQEPGKGKLIEIGYDIDRLRNYAYWLEKLADEAEQEEAQFIIYG